MSAWRREALRHLPQYKHQIENSDTLSCLWSELVFEFQDAYQTEPWDEAVIAGVYAFALWCWHGPEHQARHGTEYRGNTVEATTQAFAHFFEWLPTDAVRRRDMPRWLCLKEFEVLQAGPFTYFLGADEHAQMVQEFRRAKAGQSESHLARCAHLHLKLSR